MMRSRVSARLTKRAFTCTLLVYLQVQSAVEPQATRLSAPDFILYLSFVSYSGLMHSLGAFVSCILRSPSYRRPCKDGIVPRRSAECQSEAPSSETSHDTNKETPMPVLFIEALLGIRPEKRQIMMQKITEAIDEAYRIGDTLIFLREYPVENVVMDRRMQSENP